MNSEIAVKIGNIVQEQRSDVARNTDPTIVTHIIAADKAIDSGLHSGIRIVRGVVAGNHGYIVAMIPSTQPLTVLPLITLWAPVALTP